MYILKRFVHRSLQQSVFSRVLNYFFKKATERFFFFFYVNQVLPQNQIIVTRTTKTTEFDNSEVLKSNILKNIITESLALHYPNEKNHKNQKSGLKSTLTATRAANRATSTRTLRINSACTARSHSTIIDFAKIKNCDFWLRKSEKWKGTIVLSSFWNSVNIESTIVYEKQQRIFTMHCDLKNILKSKLHENLPTTQKHSFKKNNFNQTKSNHIGTFSVSIEPAIDASRGRVCARRRAPIATPTMILMSILGLFEFFFRIVFCFGVFFVFYEKMKLKIWLLINSCNNNYIRKAY